MPESKGKPSIRALLNEARELAYTMDGRIYNAIVAALVELNKHGEGE